MELYIFNPENDLALAYGGANYCPPPAAMRIAYDLASLPLWFAPVDDAVLLPGEEHEGFYKHVSAIFAVAKSYGGSMQGLVTRCVPWGWSPQISRRLRAMGFDEAILPSGSIVDAMREISNRRSSIRLLSALEQRGIDVPSLPLYITEPDKVAEFVKSMPRSVVKAPWSGSGKGIMWGIGSVEEPMEHFYKGVIRRQGGVVCEHFLEREVEFAMEFLVGDGAVSFAGYSLFTSFKGAYSGNILAPDDDIEQFLSSYIPLSEIRTVKEALCDELWMLVKDCGYKGYLGVDMMIYRNEGRYCLNPCMELNLRMNMGMVSRLFYDRYVCTGATGRYFVSFCKNGGDALAMHAKLQAEHPLVLEHGRVVSGYMSLTPVSGQSMYMAYVIIGSSTIEELYRS